MVSDHVLKLCQEQETVSSLLAKRPDLAPGNAVQYLYAHHNKDYKKNPEDSRTALSKEDVERARRCGRWGPTQPGPLFLKAFADSLSCLDSDPLSGMVSPPLMGSYGTCPLTVIAPLVDIIRHCSNLIARAETEVFFLTCTWAPSVAQRLVRSALIELSRRAERRKQKVVVKIMFDGAGLGAAIDPYQLVKPAVYDTAPVLLPKPEDVPWVDLEVIKMHKLPLGTLHCKFCVVDRKLAAVMSNNMEDNANMEMMVHVEGPIVESIYDTALISWHRAMNPGLPLLRALKTTGAADSTINAAAGATASTPLTATHSSSLEPSLSDNVAKQAGEEGKEDVRSSDKLAHDGEAMAARQQGQSLEHTPEDPHWDNDTADETTRIQACYSIKPGESRLQAANRQLNLAVKSPIPPTGPEIEDHDEMTPYFSTQTSAPVAMALVSRPPYGSVDHGNVHVPQNEAWLSLIRNAKDSIFIQTPDLNAKPLLPALKAALERGVEITYYVCFGYNDAGEMIPTQGGTNEQAAERLITSLIGDASHGEDHTQERPAPNKSGSTVRPRDLLHIYYYVAKDQDRPIHQSSHTRACHIKLLIADSAVGIQGSGNQDTQSWYHSQELNVMIDSAEICGRWREAIERNQNTHKFGEARGDDGVWRDKSGEPGEGYSGDPGMMKGLVHGVWGMYKKGKAAKGG